MCRTPGVGVSTSLSEIDWSFNPKVLPHGVFFIANAQVRQRAPSGYRKRHTCDAMAPYEFWGTSVLFKAQHAATIAVAAEATGPCLVPARDSPAGGLADLPGVLECGGPSSAEPQS